FRRGIRGIGVARQGSHEEREAGTSDQASGTRFGVAAVGRVRGGRTVLVEDPLPARAALSGIGAYERGPSDRRRVAQAPRVSRLGPSDSAWVGAARRLM